VEAVEKMLEDDIGTNPSTIFVSKDATVARYDSIKTKCNADDDG
jgi:hypothetical protein